MNTLPPRASGSTWTPSVSRPHSPLARLLPRRGMPDGDERERLGRLSRLNGPGELRAALLALLTRPGSAREQRAWRDETAGIASAPQVQQDMLALPAAARLPWFELFASRAARAPLRQRSALAESARRVMRADGKVDVRERLWWLALRHRHGDAPPAMLVAASGNDLARLDAAQVLAIGTFSALLSRLVPQTEPDLPLDPIEVGPPGERWYRALMRRFEPRVPMPPREPPDVDATLRALRVLQALPWMLRPVLARAWFDEALKVNDGAALPIAAADVLRLACGLLDSPLPAALARQYIEPVCR